MLEVLDRTVQAGRKISDAVLLSVLFLPWIIEELEARGSSAVTRGCASAKWFSSSAI